MTPQCQECLQQLCDALGREALPAADICLVESWVAQGFTPTQLSVLIEQQRQRGRRISSVRYFAPMVAETLTAVSRETTKRPRPRLLSERPWPEYLAVRCHGIPCPDADQIADFRFRWERERRMLGLPIDEEEE